MSAHRKIVLFGGAAVSIFLLDQLSKYWFIEIFQMPVRGVVVLCEYFSLVMAWNRGVSFSMFSHSAAWAPYVLAGMAVVVSAILARMALRSGRRIEWVGYGMVIGGALGNALDRLRFGAVADFFYAHIGDLGWPAFNIADMGIFFGVCLLLFSTLRCSSRS